MQWLHTDLPLGNLAIRGLVVYVTVLILLRIAGKRQMGQMSATEFVAILLISNAVQNAMNGGDNSLAGGIVLAAVLIAVSALISFLTYRSRIFRSVFEGTPTLLVHRGKLIKENLHRERVSVEELKTMIRKQGVHSFHELESAILEADGSLTITKPQDLVLPADSI